MNTPEDVLADLNVYKAENKYLKEEIERLRDLIKRQTQASDGLMETINFFLNRLRRGEL